MSLPSRHDHVGSMIFTETGARCESCNQGWRLHPGTPDAFGQLRGMRYSLEVAWDPADDW